jgi:hypothetical protein
LNQPLRLDLQSFRIRLTAKQFRKNQPQRGWLNLTHESLTLDHRLELASLVAGIS